MGFQTRTGLFCLGRMRVVWLRFGLSIGSVCVLGACAIVIVCFVRCSCWFLCELLLLRVSVRQLRVSAPGGPGAAAAGLSACHSVFCKVESHRLPLLAAP